MTGGKTKLTGFPSDLTLRARSIQPKFLEISVQNSMDRLGPTGKVLKKLVHLLRWTTFPSRTSLNFGWMDSALRVFPGCYNACVTCMQTAFVWTSTKNELNAQNRIWSLTFGPSITRNVIMCVLTFYHVKLVLSTALEQKCFDLWSLSPTLHNVPKLSLQQWQK